MDGLFVPFSLLASHEEGPGWDGHEPDRDSCGARDFFPGRYGELGRLGLVDPLGRPPVFNAHRIP